MTLEPVSTGPHAYMGGSPSCWALYGRLLEREYSDPAYMASHRTTVDAYAAQHPGRPEPRAIQSVNIHLVALHLTLERGAQADFVRRVLSYLAKRKGELQWLTPPASLGPLTVADALEAADPAEHAKRIEAWGRSVWTAWAPHHPEIIRIADRVIADM